MPRGVKTPDDTLAAVMAALLAGQAVNEVAAAYKIPKQTVSRIKNELTSEQLGQVGTEKADRIDDLLFDYLSENLKTLKAQAVIARDADYIKKYAPRDLAVLHGILADKAVRILEAAQSGEDHEEDPAEAADVS